MCDVSVDKLYLALFELPILEDRITGKLWLQAEAFNRN